jgi:sulfate adenylyltransferase large subunit
MAALAVPSSAPVALPSAGLLRFSTAGSVDDGKSTLIGRLLHDSKGIFEDQLVALELASRRRGSSLIDLALLTDGLRAEREQGITIDVAYRYFATPRRSFIVADTPGHIQYTRNMVTGSSTADLTVVLLDARKGVVEQTRRHMIIAALLRVPHVVAAVNKMDLIGFEEAEFHAIEAQLGGFARRLGITDIVAIPTSALQGDNVVTRSAATPWYPGPSLLEHLESVELESAVDLQRVRFPVQWVIQAALGDPDYRAYAGRVEGGVLRRGDRVVVLPNGIETTIAAIDTYDGSIEEASPPLSVAIRLADDVDVGRGGMLVSAADTPQPRRELDALVCWLGDEPIRPGGRYGLQHTTRVVRAIVDEVVDRIDINTLERDPAAATLGPNDIGRVRLRLAAPIFADPYLLNRSTGSAILVDEATNRTVGAVLVTPDGVDWPA